MLTIKELRALEILDSRGRPTLKVTCHLASGAQAAASVPSGASTGRSEALELRDGDPCRYRGLGCRRAVAHVNETIQTQLGGRSFTDQHELDDCLLELDGTPNKSRLGANALLGVSLSFARAAAAEKGQPLYEHFANLFGKPPATLPRPTINLFSGGKHAGAQAALQDVLLVPVAAKTMDQALADTFRVYQCAADLIARKYGMRLLRADEGGLAPPFPDAETMLMDAVAAIKAAEFRPGKEMALAVDAASTHFYRDAAYFLDDSPLRNLEMIERWAEWVEKYPIISLEDGLAEDDWEAWPALRQRLAGRCLVVGDDFLCTNPGRIQRAIEQHAADTLLLKVNQIGT
jgi:enolase